MVANKCDFCYIIDLLLTVKSFRVVEVWMCNVFNKVFLRLANSKDIYGCGKQNYHFALVIKFSTSILNPLPPALCKC